MTVNATSAAPRRIQPIAGHVYTLPVVRELPPQPPDAAGTGSLW